MILDTILRALTPHARPAHAVFPVSLSKLPPASPAPSVPRDPLWDVIEREHRDATQRLAQARRLAQTERVYQAKAALHGGEWEPK